MRSACLFPFFDCFPTPRPFSFANRAQLPRLLSANSFPIEIHRFPQLRKYVSILVYFPINMPRFQPSNRGLPAWWSKKAQVKNWPLSEGCPMGIMAGFAFMRTFSVNLLVKRGVVSLRVPEMDIGWPVPLCSNITAVLGRLLCAYVCQKRCEQLGKTRRSAVFVRYRWVSVIKRSGSRRGKHRALRVSACRWVGIERTKGGVCCVGSASQLFCVNRYGRSLNKRANA